MRIVKHSMDVMPVAAEGFLVGMNNGSTVEVSNAIPLPSEEGDGDSDVPASETVLQCFKDCLSPIFT